MIEAILFDMDGVLVDSEPAHAAATLEALAAFGLGPLHEQDFERLFFGRTDRSGFLAYLAEIGRADVDIEALLRTTAAAYQRRFQFEVEPFSDGIETLRSLAEEGRRIAIVSGGLRTEVDAVVERFELARCILATVSGDDVADGKPNPAPYLLGAARLGIAPQRCLVVEDAPAGIAAARRAGMRCLAVDRLGRPERLAKADRVVSHLSVAAVDDLICSLR